MKERRRGATPAATMPCAAASAAAPLPAEAAMRASAVYAVSPSGRPAVVGNKV